MNDIRRCRLQAQRLDQLAKAAAAELLELDLNRRDREFLAEQIALYLLDSPKVDPDRSEPVDTDWTSLDPKPLSLRGAVV